MEYQIRKFQEFLVNGWQQAWEYMQVYLHDFARGDLAVPTGVLMIVAGVLPFLTRRKRLGGIISGAIVGFLGVYLLSLRGQ